MDRPLGAKGSQSIFVMYVSERVMSFFVPLTRNPMFFACICMLLTIGLLLVETQIDRVSGENAIGALVLATEARSEVGPDAHVAAQQHLELGGYFVTKLDTHGIAVIATYLDENIDRNQRISPAITKMAIISSARGKSDDELLLGIHGFAEELREYGDMAYKKASFPKRFLGWKVRTPHLTSQDRLDLENSVSTFVDRGAELEKFPTFQNAQALCLSSRTAAAKLYLRWDDYQTSPSKEKIIGSFKLTLDNAISLIPKIDGNETERDLMLTYTHSLIRRRALLDKFQKGNFQELFEYLVESYDDIAMN